jgi:hypothetical protein
MAKGKDPAFLFYPGDASEDTQFMNRLERGCYFDILKAQKKFRKFSLDLIKKVLGQDFVQCWPAIESVLKKEGDLYFIEWVDNAIENRAEHSAKQKKRIKEYWDKKKQTEPIPNEYHGNTTEEPKQRHGNSLENESGNVIENENELKNKKESEKDSRGTTPHFDRPDVEGDEIYFALDTKPVRQLWASWKKYRWERYGQRYGMMGEQADLKRLEGMTYPQIQETILQAIGSGWKNLYPEKNNGKSNGTGTNKKQQHVASAAQYVAEHYENKLRAGREKPDG